MEPAATKPMTPEHIEATTIRLASKGVDLRTIWLHLECDAGRELTTEEGAALQDGWRKSAGARAEIHNRRAQTVADEARAEMRARERT